MAASSGSLVMRIVAASVAVSNRASQIIRDVMRKGELGIVEKTGKNDLQTEADRSAQRCIVASLNKLFPSVAIFGEEDEFFSVPSFAKPFSDTNTKAKVGMQLSPTEKIPNNFYEMELSKEVLNHPCPDYLRNIEDKDIVIWVDPLDGTKEYTEGFYNHVTVLIGVSVCGQAIGGVINQPFFNFKEHETDPSVVLGRCIWGVCGVGAFGFTRQQLPEGLIITTSRSHSTRVVTECIEAYNPTQVLRVGGAGHKVLLLIEGKAHAYVFATKGCKKWDTCAPEAILHAIGGSLTDMFGIQMSYAYDVQRLNAGGVLATCLDHDRFVKGVDKEILDTLVASAPAPEVEGFPTFRGSNDPTSNNGGQKKEESTTEPNRNKEDLTSSSPDSAASFDSRNSDGVLINKKSTETKL